MKITISQRKRADIMPDMMGLFFEDINYAADGGLYAAVSYTHLTLPTNA